MLVLELFNNVSGTGIKPDDCVVKSFTSSLVPGYGRLALVCDSNGFYICAAIFVIKKLGAVSFE